jgi:hypothetical protein
LRNGIARSGSHELEFASGDGFYAFWQIVVWAAYDRAAREEVLKLAELWISCAAVPKRQFARSLWRKALTVTDVTGEENLVEFCEQFISILLGTCETVSLRHNELL